MGKNYIKSIFTFLIFFAITFININEYSAKNTAQTCLYESDDGKKGIKLIMYDDGTIYGEHTKWDDYGTDYNGEKVSYWDVIRSTSNRSREYTYYLTHECPDYAAGKYSGGTYQSIYTVYTSDNTLAGTQTSDGWTYLALKETETITTITANPREVSGIYFQKPEENGWEWDYEWLDKNKTITSHNVSGGNGSYVNYWIKTKKGNVTTDGQYMNKNKLKCSADTTNGVITKVEVTWDNNYPNNTFAKIGISLDKSGTGTITCQYQKDNGDYVTSNLTINFTSTNEESSYNKKDLKCSYTLQNGVTLADAEVVITDYNDGYNAKPTITYYIKGKAGDFIPMSTYDETMANYQFYQAGHSILGKKLGFKVTYENFLSSLRNTGNCPNLYTYDYWYFGSYHGVALSANNGVRSIPKTYKRSSSSSLWTDITPEDLVGGDGEVMNNGCSVQVKYEHQNGNTLIDETIVFFKSTSPLTGQTTYSYNLIGGTDKTISSLDTNLDIVVDTTYSGYGGVSSSYSTHILFAPEYLKEIYDNYGICEVQTACVRKNNDINAGIWYSESTTYYEVTFDEETCAFDENTSIEEGTNVVDSSTDVGVANGYETHGGKTDELIISDIEGNSGELKCDDLFYKKDPKTGALTSEHNGLWEVVHTVRLAIQIGTPILLILLTMVDFTKATAVDEAIPKAKKNAITRAIIAVIIFMLPSLLKIVLEIVGFGSCGI